jgi:hypothetical protein
MHIRLDATLIKPQYDITPVVLPKKNHNDTLQKYFINAVLE